jgi:hypothetical protein
VSGFPFLLATKLQLAGHKLQLAVNRNAVRGCDDGISAATTERPPLPTTVSRALSALAFDKSS